MIDTIARELSSWQIIMAFILACISILASLNKLLAIVRNAPINLIKRYGVPDELTKQIVEKHVKIFIPTRLQENNNEPNKARIYRFNEFIKLYIEGTSNKYHYILGESGMGKSTFLINLYYRYNSSPRKKYIMYYYNLRNNKAINSTGNNLLSQLKNTLSKEQRSRVILLLDAFDEWVEASLNIYNAQKLIEENTDWAIKVIITCRTQFFNTFMDEPYHLQLGHPLGDEIYTKHYICFFTLKDIDKYLRKKYDIRSILLRRGALRIIHDLDHEDSLSDKSSNLMLRPLILSFIDFIVDKEYPSPHLFINKTDIYQKILSKWIDYEIIYFIKTENLNYNNETKNELIKNYTDTFWKFLYEIAKIMLDNRESDNYTISYNDLHKCANEFKINFITGEREKSLLTRTNDFKFTFVHQSILEYLISKCIAEGYFLYYYDKIKSLDQIIPFVFEIRRSLHSYLYSKIEEEHKLLENMINSRLEGDWVSVSSSAHSGDITVYISFDSYKLGVERTYLLYEIITNIDYNKFNYLLLPFNDHYEYDDIKYCFFIGNYIFEKAGIFHFRFWQRYTLFVRITEKRFCEGHMFNDNYKRNHKHNYVYDHYDGDYYTELKIVRMMQALRNKKIIENEAIEITDHFINLFDKLDIYDCWEHINQYFDFSIYRIKNEKHEEIDSFSVSFKHKV